MPLFRRTTTPLAEGGRRDLRANDEGAVEPKSSGKGRPTPKRSETQRRPRGPLAAPTTRKEAYGRTRGNIKDERRQARQALVTGDERHLPRQHAGPAKRLARDVVDARLSVGEYLMPVILVCFVISLVAGGLGGKTKPGTALTTGQVIGTFASYVMLVMLIASVVQAYLIGRRAKQAVMNKYGMGEAHGITFYAGMRAIYLRALRRPPPKVKRGEVVT